MSLSPRQRELQPFVLGFTGPEAFAFSRLDERYVESFELHDAQIL